MVSAHKVEGVRGQVQDLVEPSDTAGVADAQGEEAGVLRGRYEKLPQPDRVVRPHNESDDNIARAEQGTLLATLPCRDQPPEQNAHEEESVNHLSDGSSHVQLVE